MKPGYYIDHWGNLALIYPDGKFEQHYEQYYAAIPGGGYWVVRVHATIFFCAEWEFISDL